MKSQSGRPGLPVPNKPDGFCGRKATLKLKRTLLFNDSVVSSDSCEVKQPPCIKCLCQFSHDLLRGNRGGFPLVPLIFSGERHGRETSVDDRQQGMCIVHSSLERKKDCPIQKCL